MLAFLTWFEDSALGAAVRGAGVWAYGVVNLVHILGVATLFGSVLVLDLRLVGLWRQVPLSLIARPTVPLAAAGFCIAVVSGLCLLSTNATEYAGNPFLLIKFAAIALGLLNIVVLSRFDAWRQRDVREPDAKASSQLAIAGGVSLASWLIAVSAGRLIGYW